jgi:hypothetical protein
VEAKYVILEKPSIYCCQILLHNSDCPVVWNNVLGCRQKKVMIIDKNEVEKCNCQISYGYRGHPYSIHHKLAVNWRYYFYSCRDSQQDLFNAMGSMYASVIFMGVQNSGSIQPVVSVERTVFYRERAAHMYSPLPYALGQVKFTGIDYIQQSVQMNVKKKIVSKTEIAH